MSADGALSLADFKYLPSEPSAQNKVPADVIRNTAMGTARIDRPVDKYIRDAVFSELRLVGIKTNDNSRVLSGDIQEFLIDDLGYSVDWTLRIRYVLTDATSKGVVFDSIKETKRNTAKFANAFGAMNETVKLNVEELLKDSRFRALIAGVQSRDEPASTQAASSTGQQAAARPAPLAKPQTISPTAPQATVSRSGRLSGVALRNHFLSLGTFNATAPSGTILIVSVNSDGSFSVRNTRTNGYSTGSYLINDEPAQVCFSMDNPGFQNMNGCYVIYAQDASPPRFAMRATTRNYSLTY